MPAVPLPHGYHSVNPYVVVDDADALIEFLTVVFGGREQGERELAADGRVDHADVLIGDSLVMVSSSSETYPARPSVYLAYVDDVDVVYRTALEAGATSIVEPADQSWGDRTGGIVDPFDNRWWIATHLREFS
jgi:uncharacterized glyoxalase superfamily protein PhnB